MPATGRQREASKQLRDMAVGAPSFTRGHDINGSEADCGLGRKKAVTVGLMP